MESSEIKKRFSEINALEPDVPTDDEIKAIRQSVADSETVSLEDFKRKFEEYKHK